MTVAAGEIANLAAATLSLEADLKMFHWQAKRAGHHAASDAALANLREQADRLIEAYQGHARRRLRFAAPASMTVGNVARPEDIQAAVEAYLAELERVYPRLPTPALRNVVDDIATGLLTFLYLLQFD